MNTIYDIFNNDGQSSAKKVQTLETSDAGQPGWGLQTYSVAGVDYVLLIAEKGAATFPMHDDPNDWLGYIVEGQGQLHLGDAESITEKVAYKAGDIIHFTPGTYHGWESTSDRSKLMFVKVAE